MLKSLLNHVQRMPLSRSKTTAAFSSSLGLLGNIKISITTARQLPVQANQNHVHSRCLVSTMTVSKEALKTEMDQMLKSWVPFDFEKVKELVEAGANIDQVAGSNRNTILSKAVRDECDLACCEWLIERSNVTTINCVDDYGYTPLYNAIRDQRLALAKLLIQHGANVNTLTEDGKSSPLHYACEYGYLDFVMLMVEEGNASLTTVDVLRRTPLFVASLEGRFEIVRYLLEHDDADASSINIMDEDGRTPFMIAQQKGYRYMDIANLLEEMEEHPDDKLKLSNAGRQKDEQQELEKEERENREMEQKEQQEHTQQEEEKKQRSLYFDGKPILSADELQLVLEFVTNKIISFSNPMKNMNQFLKLANVVETLFEFQKKGILPSLKNLEDVQEDDEKAQREKLVTLMAALEEARDAFEQRRKELEEM